MVTEDEEKFGVGKWVYCRQHLRPHVTGWCTVSADQKTSLDATTIMAAIDECDRRGFRIFKG